jgi:hypothetical protein
VDQPRLPRGTLPRMPISITRARQRPAAREFHSTRIHPLPNGYILLHLASPSHPNPKAFKSRTITFPPSLNSARQH